MAKRPNILLILNDDMGYSDIGCYGGEVMTPTLDSLAASGIRYTQFYNTARCCPSRASLLTGLHPTQADVGDMTSNDGIDGYLGDLARNAVTLAEALKPAGYATVMSGKWHVTNRIHDEADNENWPRQRGFDRYFGILDGANNYFQPHSLKRDNTHVDPLNDTDESFYTTDAFSDAMVGFINDHFEGGNDQPLFAYLAYTAPHWPLHAKPEDIAKYAGRFDAGWDTLRQERIDRMIEMGIIDPSWKLSPRDPDSPPWETVKDKAWEAFRMEVYAAQIDAMDQGIGRVVQALKEAGELDNTLIVFLADNGGCAEQLHEGAKDWGMHPYPRNTRDGRTVVFGNDRSLRPGDEDTFMSYDLPWANLSNTPFKEYKHWIHEGGISTPFIVHWPEGIDGTNELRHCPAQLPDMMATFLDVAGAQYPTEYEGRQIQPLEGFSLAPSFNGGPFEREYLTWEHEGNRGCRRGKWKLVRKNPRDWELYDMEADRTELNDLSQVHPEIVEDLSAEYFRWAKRCGVMDYDELLAHRAGRDAT
jgi:arylsulfatase A-like enzyme